MSNYPLTALLATPAGRKDFEKAMMKSVMKSVMGRLTLAPKTKRSSKVDTSDVVFDRLKRRIITEFETSIAPMLAKNRAERANLAFLNQEKENLALLLSQKNRKPRTDLANLSDVGDTLNPKNIFVYVRTNEHVIHIVTTKM